MKDDKPQIMEKTMCAEKTMTRMKKAVQAVAVMEWLI
jgi:hypothetical protein